jgi:hypothetical protein
MDFSSNLILMWTTKVKPFVCQMRSFHPFSKPFIGVSYIDISIFVILGRLLRTKFSKQAYCYVCNCHGAECRNERKIVFQSNGLDSY